MTLSAIENILVDVTRYIRIAELKGNIMKMSEEYIWDLLDFIEGFMSGFVVGE